MQLGGRGEAIPAIVSRRARSPKTEHSSQRPAILDLVIRSARVVTPHGVGAFDAAIRSDKIVASRARIPRGVAADPLEDVADGGRFIRIIGA